jgi:uncharacterized protein (DUF2236 family)
MHVISIIDDKIFNEQLAWVRSCAAGSHAGVFGPRSMMWRINGEAAIFLGAGRALLLQVAHPWIAQAIHDHSRAFVDPIGRFHRTFNVMFTLIFGTLEQALTAARHLHKRHAAVRGVLSENVGPFDQGTLYDASDLASLRWVHATLIETAILARGLVLPNLSLEELERYYEESCLLAALFGIPRAALPADWHQFLAYNTALYDSDVLSVGPAGHELAWQLMNASQKFFPRWYWAMTAQMLPVQLRAAFGFRLDQMDLRSAERALSSLRYLYPLLPSRLRHVGPFHEAKARVAGKRHIGLLTQLSNQFWIGNSRLIS